MSRYTVAQPITGAEVAYGSDHALGYFVEVFVDGEDAPVISECSLFDGLTHGKFLERLEQLAVIHLVPSGHQRAISLDMRF